MPAQHCYTEGKKNLRTPLNEMSCHCANNVYIQFTACYLILVSCELSLLCLLKQDELHLLFGILELEAAGLLWDLDLIRKLSSLLKNS